MFFSTNAMSGFASHVDSRVVPNSFYGSREAKFSKNFAWPALLTPGNAKFYSLEHHNFFTTTAEERLRERVHVDCSLDGADELEHQEMGSIWQFMGGSTAGLG